MTDLERELAEAIDRGFDADGLPGSARAAIEVFRARLADPAVIERAAMAAGAAELATSYRDAVEPMARAALASVLE